MLYCLACLIKLASATRIKQYHISVVQSHYGISQCRSEKRNESLALNRWSLLDGSGGNSWTRRIEHLMQIDADAADKSRSFNFER